MFSFLQSVRTELKNVTWPGRSDVIRLTAVVIAISLIVGAYIGVVDLVFTKLLEYIVK